jgi:hypothetical protein
MRSVVAVAWMQVAVVAVVGAVRMFVAARLLHLRLAEYGRILAPVLAGTAVMAVAVQATLLLTAGAEPVLRLALSIAAGILSYTSAMWIIQRDVIVEAGQTLKTVFSRA